ncbi:MAG: 1-(5-phosphoribosyl)-5-[(5-phosphoribosylamino)methylideneamino]imidazole-4-carboxamide isomerase [Planctomycetales bacterium]|nr:1-(5-phosphoribosyl)-5-[(5-phosphoribosylamino)methylideneamino]imidazole-4-carboxamide isomerase [Planctomycetales bacterium]
MEIWPAIDIRGGKCVRLQQGDYQRETIFGEDPVAMGLKWVSEGAERLHLVDLDGARDGHVANRAVIERVVQSVGVPCELGGGIRNEQTVADWLSIGLKQVVIGTRAIEDEAWFRAIVEKFPHQVVLGIDARDGKVATDGWLKTSGTEATELAQRFNDAPLAAIVYTDIAKDGMLCGPNYGAMAEMKQAAACPVIASGGVSQADDIGKLAELGLDGCIVGRALYEQRLTLSDALRMAKRESSQN